MRKCALVTGGSNGIGRAISIAVAGMGYHVLINYSSNDAAAEETMSAISAKGGSAELLKFDVSKRTEVEKNLDSWIDSNTESIIEVLVNNAGITKDNLMIWMKSEEWEDVINVNLNSFFYVTRMLLKGMVSNRYGRIVNVVSLSGLKGVGGQTNYSASKGGVIAATRSLAQEVAKKNVTVNAVAPGFIHSEMTKNLNEKDFKNYIPMQRFGKPEEVANAVAFLVSEKASYITGEVLSINGGIF
jgi:3-oxoacyl-[acyl-carrier protein] reductase